MGWKNGTADFDFSAAIKADITLKAVWEEVKNQNQTLEYDFELFPLEFDENKKEDESLENYQVLKAFIPAEIVLKKGDTVKINISGSCDTALTDFCFFIADNTETAGWWKQLSGYGRFAESVDEKTEVTLSATVTITEDQVGESVNAHKVALYYSKEVGKKATFYAPGKDYNSSILDSKNLLDSPQDEPGGCSVFSLAKLNEYIAEGYDTLVITMENKSEEDRNGWGILNPVVSDGAEPWD